MPTPLEETSNAGVLTGARGRSCRLRYSCTASRVLGCSGSARDFPNFPLRTMSRPLLSSKSSLSSRIASPTLIPQFRGNASNATLLPSSPRTKLERCSPLRTGGLGPAGVITPCSRSRSRPGCAFRNSPGFGVSTFTSTPALMSTAWARGGSSGLHRSLVRRSPFYASGSPNAPVTKSSPHSQHARAAHSAVMLSSVDSPST